MVNTNKALLDVKGLTVRIGNRVLVDRLNFEIQPGETHALVGESGSGKSLSALSIMGLLGQDLRAEGQRLLDGIDLGAMAPSMLRHHRGKEVGFVFQEPMTSLNPVHTIGQQVGEAIKLHQKTPSAERRKRVVELLKLVNLPDPEEMVDVFPHTLSGGQRQRVMIAIAIANRPRLLIADEPTTALDVTVARDILELLNRLKHEMGMGLLLITHDLNLVRRYAQHVSVMRYGKLVEAGTTEEVMDRPQHAYTRGLLEAEPSGAPAALPDNAMNVLQVIDLSVKYSGKKRLFRKPRRSVQALSDLNLELRERETLGIVGESGSGKSTLAKTILGMQHGTGVVSFLGQRVDQFSVRQWRPLRSKIQFVFQDPYGSLSPRMSVFDIIAEGLRFHQRELGKREIETRVQQVLKDVELDADMRDRYPHEFSGGQRARIALARTLVLEPRLLILDEPTAALDRQVQMHLIDLLRRIQRERGLSYIFISHDLAVVKAMSHRVLVLKDGNVIEQGDARAVFESPREAYTQRLVSASVVGQPASHDTDHSCGNG